VPVDDEKDGLTASALPLVQHLAHEVARPMREELQRHAATRRHPEADVGGLTVGGAVVL